VRRLESRLGLRLLHRTTRHISPTEAGARLAERLAPALAEVEASLDVVNHFRDRPAGTLRINVPANVARTVLPGIVAPFLKLYPEIRQQVIVEGSFAYLMASGCDPGIRYDERLEQDMVALPIGPRTQRLITAAAPAYLQARGIPNPARPAATRLPARPVLRWRDTHLGVRTRWRDRARRPTRPAAGALGRGVRPGTAAALDGLGIIHLFEDWLQPHLDSGALVAVLEPWCQRFSGPLLYYSGRRHLPSPLRAFVEFVRGI
jgi:DNA-binding transcriptional LysR family regulator